MTLELKPQRNPALRCTDLLGDFMNTLTRKGYARIYVEKPEDVARVKNIIKELDAFEFEYLPEKLVAPFAEYPALAYTHKFDGLCMNRLTAICWQRGIHIWTCDNGINEWMDAATSPNTVLADKKSALPNNEKQV